MTAMTAMTNRKPIYADAKPDARVISAPGGYWFPQKRVSHTPGCKKGWRWATEGAGYYVQDKDAPHCDRWANISEANLTRTQAIMLAFGPKVAYQTKLIV